MRRTGFRVLALAALLLGGCQAERSVRPGINDPYRKPNVDEWVGRFEVESREIYRERERIAEYVGAKTGMEIADVGAGTGFMAILFGKKVGRDGRVYAVDIVPEFLERIEQLAREENVPNVTPVLGAEDSVKLPPNSIDLAFICDTYHHFEYPRGSMRSIRRALRPGGEVAIIDFQRIPGVSRDWVMEHVRAGKDTVIEEVKAAGFELIDDGAGVDFLEENYIIRFRKRG